MISKENYSMRQTAHVQVQWVARVSQCTVVIHRKSLLLIISFLFIGSVSLTWCRFECSSVDYAIEFRFWVSSSHNFSLFIDHTQKKTRATIISFRDRARELPKKIISCQFSASLGALQHTNQIRIEENGNGRDHWKSLFIFDFFLFLYEFTFVVCWLSEQTSLSAFSLWASSTVGRCYWTSLRLRLSVRFSTRFFFSLRLDDVVVSRDKLLIFFSSSFPKQVSCFRTKYTLFFNISLLFTFATAIDERWWKTVAELQIESSAVGGGFGSRWAWRKNLLNLQFQLNTPFAVQHFFSSLPFIRSCIRSILYFSVWEDRSTLSSFVCSFRRLLLLGVRMDFSFWVRKFASEILSCSCSTDCIAHIKLVHCLGRHSSVSSRRR